MYVCVCVHWVIRTRWSRWGRRRPARRPWGCPAGATSRWKRSCRASGSSRCGAWSSRQPLLSKEMITQAHTSEAREGALSQPLQSSGSTLRWKNSKAVCFSLPGALHWYRVTRHWRKKQTKKQAKTAWPIKSDGNNKVRFWEDVWTTSCRRASAAKPWGKKKSLFKNSNQLRLFFNFTCRNEKNKITRTQRNNRKSINSGIRTMEPRLRQQAWRGSFCTVWSEGGKRLWFDWWQWKNQSEHSESHNKKIQLNSRSKFKKMRVEYLSNHS